MFQQKLFSLGGFHLKSAGFHLKSTGFHVDFMKCGGFHEIRRISCEIERPLARNCNPMFKNCASSVMSSNKCHFKSNLHLNHG